MKHNTIKIGKLILVLVSIALLDARVHASPENTESLQIRIAEIAAVSSKDALSVVSVCKRNLLDIEPLFDSAYDLDVYQDWCWKRYVRRCEESHGNYLPFRQWSEEFSKKRKRTEKDWIVILITNCGKKLYELQKEGKGSYRDLINEMNLSASLSRAVEDAALLFHFSGTEDNWQAYGEIELRHATIVSESSEAEAMALNLRMVRQLARLPAVPRGLSVDRIRYRNRAQFIDSCLNAESIQHNAIVWFRCLDVIKESRALAQSISEMEGTSLGDYSVETMDGNGFFHPGTTEDKKRILSGHYVNSGNLLRARTASSMWRSLSGFSIEMVERIAKETAVELGISDSDEIVRFVEFFDFRICDSCGDMTGFWARKTKREGWDLPKTLSQTINGRPDPGHLEPYPSTESLKTEMTRYGLSSGIFAQEDSANPGTTNRLSFLLYTPKGGEKVPLLLFIPGSGEIGVDLLRQFRQRTIFEKVTSAEFQKKHPCYLLVVSPQEDAPDLCGRTSDWKPGTFQKTFLDAVNAVVHSRKSPAVDVDRIYATGLSYGGRAVYGLSFVAPHLFAACAPVSSGVFSPDDVREERPGNWWHLYNEGDYARHPDSIPRLEAFAARVRELGGDFRIGTYPEEGHNAWDSAWREDALWDWMFAKSLENERHASAGGTRSAKTAKVDHSLVGEVVCTASKVGFDSKRGPERAVDGLDATAYVSAAPMGPGDWWLCEFKEPVTGRIRVQTGWLDGTKRLSRGHVEVSKDGKLWSRAASISQKTGEASFQQRDSIRFVKLLVEPRTPEVLTLRELRLE